MQKTFNTRTTLLAGIAALALAGASVVFAQEYAPPAQTEQQPPMQTQFSENELESFAAAFVKVSEIADQYTPRIEAAEDLDQAIEIRQQATDAMVDAIEAEGLDPETYNAVVNAAANDPQLGARLEQLIQQEQGG